MTMLRPQRHWCGLRSSIASAAVTAEYSSAITQILNVSARVCPASGADLDMNCFHSFGAISDDQFAKQRWTAELTQKR
eukprot:2290110-Pleurochrysis_carterae.AAC.2